MSQYKGYGYGYGRYSSYGKYKYLHMLIDVLIAILILAMFMASLLLYESELNYFINKYNNILDILLIIAIVLFFIINFFIHNTIEKITDYIDNKPMTYKQFKNRIKNSSDKIEPVSDLNSLTKKQVNSRMSIYPKTREQLYNLRKGDYLKFDGKRFEIVKEYDETNDTITVLEDKKTVDCDIITSEIYLKAEKVFEQLGITPEMTSLEFYVDKLNNYANDKQVILPEKTIKNVNKLFECYYPFIEDDLKLNKFIDNINKDKLVLNKDEIANAFEYFNTQVNPFMYDLCMCYIAIHEYDDLMRNKEVKLDLHKIYRICKTKLPWINYKILDLYLFHIWKEKGASSC